MNRVGHFIAGELLPTDTGSQIFNPSNGKPSAIAAIGTQAEVNRAVAAARVAFPAWSAQGLQNRATVMLKLRGALQNARHELVDIVVAELGKTLADAGAEVDRAIEVLGQSASIGSWYGGAFSPGVSSGVDAMEVRFPIGVVVAISPFNFPVLIPVVQSAIALACGNTVVLKPSERDPSATLRVAEIFSRAGLPQAFSTLCSAARQLLTVWLIILTSQASAFLARHLSRKRFASPVSAATSASRRSGAGRTTWWCCRTPTSTLLRMRPCPLPTVRQGSVAWQFQWWLLSGRLVTPSSTRSKTDWPGCAQVIPPRPPPRSAH